MKDLRVKKVLKCVPGEYKARTLSLHHPAKFLPFFLIATDNHLKK
jgi:hypothetical protein